MRSHLPYGGDCNEFLQKASAEGFREHPGQSAAVVAYYRRAPWSDSELLELLKPMIGQRGYSGEGTIGRLLRALSNGTACESGV